MALLKSKGFAVRGQLPKGSKRTDEKVLTSEQVQMILKACKAESMSNSDWRRDHCAIYLGYMLGLRVGEACLLQRKNTDEMDARESVKITTLKNIQRIPFQCKNGECRRKVNVMASRSGQEFRCPRCSVIGIVSVPKYKISGVPPEIELPFVEPIVRDYIHDYMDNTMRPDQRWFFEGNNQAPMSRRNMSRIFSTYTALAGLSAKYSWHALRHGRGVALYRIYDGDLIMVRDGLRQKDVGTTQVYVHMDPARKQEHMDRANKSTFDPSETM